MDYVDTHDADEQLFYKVLFQEGEPVVEYQTKQRMSNITTYIIIVVIMAISFFPLYWIIVTSLKTKLDFLEFPPKMFFFKPTLSAYRNVFIRDKFYQYLFNSILIVSGSVILSLVISTPAAYSLARFQSKWADRIAMFVLGLRMFPPVAIILPIYFLFQMLKLLDTHIALILLYTLLNLPLTTWVLRAFIMEIPKEVEESAMLDGHSMLKIIWKVVIPLIKPGVIATAILSFMFSWNEFLFAYILASRSAKTAPVAAVTYVGMRDVRWAETTAASLSIVIPMIIILFIVQKHLVRGLTFGSVKG
jgi:multiple sugar transport system permease protein